jgi:hypothetical protein
MARVTAVLAAFNGGDAQVDALVSEHFAETARAEASIDERRQWYAQQRKQFGTISSAGHGTAPARRRHLTGRPARSCSPGN